MQNPKQYPDTQKSPGPNEGRGQTVRKPALPLTTDKQRRKEIPIARGVFDYFPNALAEVARVSFVGNQQHNPGEPLHWERNKSTDHADCIARHLIERGTVDDDGLLHAAKLAWRALALLQIELEERDEGRQYERYTESVVDRDTKAVADTSVNLTYYNGVPATYPTRSPWLGQCVYVAGPMRGYPDFNFPAFDEARDRLLAEGIAVISPADLDRASGIHEKTPVAEVVGAEISRTIVLRDSAALLALRAENGDAIVMLPGWEKSAGAAAELLFALWLGLKVVDGRTMSSFRGQKVQDRKHHSTLRICPDVDWNALVIAAESRIFVPGHRD